MGLDQIDRKIREALRPLANRIGNSVARAVIHLVDDARKQQLVQLGLLTDETLDGAEHFHPYGLSSVPLPGAEAVVVFPGGDRAHPLVVAVSDRRHRPTGGEPGEVTVYNDKGASIRMTKDGDIEVTPATGREVIVKTEGGTAGKLLKLSEFLNHSHASFGAPPAEITPSVPPGFDGTGALRSE